MKTLASNTQIPQIGTASFPDAAGILRRVTNAARNVFNGISNELATRRAIAELQALDDHALKDIGLNRSLIETVVRGKINETFPR